MIYDLLNVDIGWMQKKTGSSVIKSKVLQLIILIKAIIEAVNKNGLNCGTDSNFDEPQMKYILEDTLSKYTDTKFKVNEDGTITITMPGGDVISTTDNSSETSDSDTVTTDTTSTDSVDTGIGSVTIPTTTNIEQKAQKSGIIIKNCLRGLNLDQIKEVESWFIEYERSLNG